MAAKRPLYLCLLIGRCGAISGLRPLVALLLAMRKAGMIGREAAFYACFSYSKWWGYKWP